MGKSNLQRIMVEITYTLNQISLHNKPDDTWIIIDNKVLDVTKFLKEHPGGEQTILDWAGKDGTVGFDEVGHSQDAWDMIDDYVVGMVDESEQTQSKSKKSKEDKKSSNSIFKP